MSSNGTDRQSEVGLSDYKHTEQLKQILSDFTSNLLLHKPDDIYSFARDYFTTAHSSGVTTSSLPLKRKPVPIAIAGPSGVGKGTLIGKLLKEYPDKFGFSVSHTTRKPRPGEEDGIHYHFTTLDLINPEIQEGKFIEHANVHGNIYGTSKVAIEKVLNEGKACILDIDVQGCEQIKKSTVPAKFIFVAPPSVEDLEKRLRGRGTETEETIQKRMKNALGEMEYTKKPEFFDIIIVNDNLENAYNEFKNYIFKNVM